MPSVIEAESNTDSDGPATDVEGPRAACSAVLGIAVLLDRTVDNLLV